MNRFHTDQQNLEMPPVTEDNSRVNRPITPPACLTSGLASVISIFCAGLVSGGAGGLLFGATAVVVLQSLELLADNRLLMDQLGKHIMDSGYNETNNLHDIEIPTFTVMFGIFVSAFSLGAGIYIGLSMYLLVIKIKGETAMGKALSLAGPVCLMGITATGYILGLALVSFLSITLSISLRFFIPVVVVYVFMLIAEVWLYSIRSFILWPFTLIFIFYIFLIGFANRIRLILGAVLVPATLATKELEQSYSLKLIIAPVPLMLTISDVYNIAGQHIVSLQTPNSTYTHSDVLEAIFVGVLTPQLLTATVGMSLFASRQRGGAGKICAAAAGSGVAVLGVIKAALPVLGPGPSIGAQMGVAGAVGVSLSAAVEATDQYGEVVDHYSLVGRVGVTVGAAIGAFLSSCAHSGLSAVFMGLCAATLPAGAFLKQLFSYSTPRVLCYCLWICLFIPAVVITFTNIMWLHRVQCMFILVNVYLGFYKQFLPDRFNFVETTRQHH